MEKSMTPEVFMDWMFVIWLTLPLFGCLIGVAILFWKDAK